MQSSPPKVQGARSADVDVGDTLDGADRVIAEVRPALPPAQVDDYAELVQVERRHYVISGEIAKGGMGRVLAARDLRLGRSVAIKELLPGNRDAVRRFEREARITARLQHPAIIHVYEAGVWPGGEPFYAMTRVSGRSLDKVVAERPTLVERIGLLPNVIAVVDALAYAHSQDVIHRDLKPSNVLVGEFGETVVIDWGLAKDLAALGDPTMSLRMPPSTTDETLSGSVVGTPAYMPPEQARGEPLDHRADVYALGALLYHVLVGGSPYTGTTSKQILEQVLAGPPVAVEAREPGAPADLVAVVAKAMARDPADRYATAGELATDLKRFQTGQLVAAHHYTPGQLFWRWLQRNRLVIGIATAALAALATLGTITIRQIVAERDRAELEQHKAELRRAALLEERGRSELLALRAGPALVNLVGVAGDRPDGALAFLIAEAMRPFESDLVTMPAGDGNIEVAYRPDGSLIATASRSGRIALWNGRTGALVREVDHGRGAVLAIAWDAAGERFATAGEDRVARVWTASGTLERELRKHEHAIRDVAFSADHEHVITGSEDGSAIVWTLANDETVVLREAEERSTGQVNSTRITPDGQRAVTAHTDGIARVWDTRTGKLQVLLKGHQGPVLVALWDDAGQRIMTASTDGTARIWDPKKGEEMGKELGKELVVPLVHDRNASIDAIAWSHDGSRVLTAGADRFARVWELPEPPVEGAMPEAARLIGSLPHTDAVVAATFSADDRWIATAGRVARVWDAAGQPVAAFEHGDAVGSVVFSADGAQLVTGTRGGTARIWNLPRELFRAPIELDSPAHAIAVAPDGTVAVGADDSRVTIVRGGATLPRLRAHSGSVFAVGFSPDGTHLVTAGEDSVAFVWKVGDKTPLHSLPHSDNSVTYSVAFSPDGSRIATGDSAGVLRLWTLDGRLVRTVASEGRALRSVAFGPRGDVIVGGFASGSLVVWTSAGELLARRQTRGPVRSVAFDASGAVLAVGGVDYAQIWRFGAALVPSLALAIEGPTGEVRAVAVSRDGSRVVTAGTDGVAQVWDVAKGKLLATRDPQAGAIDAISLSADDATLWTASADGTARVWDVHAVSSSIDRLTTFIERHVPWRLGEDDVVHPVIQEP